LPQCTADVRFGSKADVTLLNSNIRFSPESGHWLSMSGFDQRDFIRLDLNNPPAIALALTAARNANGVCGRLHAPFYSNEFFDGEMHFATNCIFTSVFMFRLPGKYFLQAASVHPVGAFAQRSRIDLPRVVRAIVFAAAGAAVRLASPQVLANWCPVARAFVLLH
jgi:hypothetical protein